MCGEFAKLWLTSQIAARPQGWISACSVRVPSVKVEILREDDIYSFRIANKECVMKKFSHIYGLLGQFMWKTAEVVRPYYAV